MINVPDFSLDLFLNAATFLGVLMAFEGIRQLLSRGETAGETRNRRLRMVSRGAKPEDVLRILKPRADGWPFERLPLVGQLPTELRQAGITQSAGRLVLLCAGLTVIFAVSGSRFFPVTLTIPFAILLFTALPLVALRMRARKRIETLTRQLPDALDLMSRGLRVGHPLNTTMASVASEMSDPVASEFGVMVDQISYGDELVDAFRDLADRIGTEDARFLAVSVAIQHGTGGDLARMLSTLARVIRDRLSMRRKIKAISAEGRLSAAFLSFIPVVIVVAMTLLVPTYYGDISDDPMFRPAAIVVIGLLIANALALRRLVNFKF
jgi:tight adherence protein B